MTTHSCSVTYQPINIVQNLPFEIIAVPKDNAYQQPNALQNRANQQFDSFKIRIKNKKEPGVKRAVISVPKLSTSYSKKVRLVNSDQTILSFDLFMDAPASKRTQNKNQKKIFQMLKPNCLNAQNKDDNDPYTSTSCNGQENIQNISDNNTNNRNANKAEKFALKKNFVPKNTSAKPHRSFLGQCKPGGCLDPPYNEDKYPYKRTDHFCPLSLEADIDEKIDQNGKLKSRNEVNATITSEIDAITYNIPSKIVGSSQLRNEENDDNNPNSLITYPHAIESRKINITGENQNNKTKPRTSAESKPKFLVNEFPEVYYMPPKKTKTKRSTAKYSKYENKTPSGESKILNFLIKNDVTTAKLQVENIVQSPEPIKDDSQLEYENKKETSQQIKKLFHHSLERQTITSNEDSHIPVFNDKVNTTNISSMELVPVVNDTKRTTKTLPQNSLMYFGNPSTSDEINKTDVLPEKEHKNISELDNLINILDKSSETPIKTNSKDLYVLDSKISLKTYEVPSINKLSIHELVDSTSIRGSSTISNKDKIEVDSKDINVLYEDEKLFDISCKTSLESFEQIDSRLEINKNELSAISKKDKNNQGNVITPILNNTDKQLQIVKPEITPKHKLENNLMNDSKQGSDEILFIKPEKFTDTSINADNRTPDIAISKSRLRQDSTEMDLVINNDRIKQLKYSPKSFQKSLCTLKGNDIKQKKKISLQTLEFQSKEIHTLSSSLDTLDKKSEENGLSNIELTNVNSIFVRTKSNEAPKIDTKSVHSIESSALEIKHPSRDFMKQNNDASVLNSALNSPVKDFDTKINFESDNIIKNDSETDIFKDLSNEEKDLKDTTNSNEKTLTPKRSMVDDEMRPALLQVELVKFATANNTEQNNDEDNDKLKYNKISNQSFENQQKTNERILNKIIMNSNISSKIFLSQSMETVERSITNNTNSKSSLKVNGKDRVITGTSKEFSFSFQLKNETNDAKSLEIKHKSNQSMSQTISPLEKNKSPSQSVLKIQAKSKEKTVESTIISTVPEVLIDSNVTDDKVKSKKVEQLNEEKLNEIRDESDYFATKSLIDLQVAEMKFTPLEYEEQANVSYTQPHKKLNSAAFSSSAINFQSRVAKSEDKAFIQTYDLAMPIQENVEERATIKPLIRENNKEIRIHINSDTDLTLCIMKNRIPTKKVTSMTIVEEEKYIHETSSSDKMLNNDILLQDTLNSVYDSLAPLQEIISNLAEEVKLLSQQQMLLGQLLSKMETKPLRTLNTHQTCKCNKN